MGITRRHFTTLAAAAALPGAAPREYWAYIGTYTGPKSKAKGIYAVRFDSSTGKVGKPELAVETTSPSFVALHPTGRYLYAANEVGNFGGERSASVTAFSIDNATGKMKELNAVASGGTSACYVACDKKGTRLFVANYGTGSLAAMPIVEGGKLEPRTSFFELDGKGPNEKRQNGSHAHSIQPSPDNRFVLLADLGSDRMYVYRFDGKVLTPNDPPYATLDPGSGPRHFAFHPNGRHVYAINELLNTVTAFEWDAKKGVLTKKATVTTLPSGFSGESHTAEVVVHPNGRFLYGSNRGHDSLAMFRIGSKGELTSIGHTPTQGSTPRNFALDPTGNWLFAANQRSDNVVLFRVDTKTGALTPTGDTFEVGSPVCVRFLAIG